MRVAFGSGLLAGLPILAADAQGSATSTVRLQLDWPSAPANVEHYRTAEECLTAIRRVSDSVGWARLSDTIPVDPSGMLRPVHEVVTETARRCPVTHHGASVPLQEWYMQMQILLAAQRDTEVSALVANRLAPLQTTDSVRAFVLDSIVQLYLGARPVRFAVATPLIEELVASGSRVPVLVRLRALVAELQAAADARDTVSLLRASNRLVTMSASLTSRERRNAVYDTAGTFFVYQALNYLDGKRSLDVLHQGTAPFAEMRRANWAKATGGRADAFQLPVGESAPPLQGDFWFRATSPETHTQHPSDRTSSAAPPTGTRPTRGQVALILFLQSDGSGGCRREFTHVACLDTYAALRRLAQRFPELEVTVVSQTAGFHSVVAIPTPEREAEQLRAWWHDTHQLPGALVITQTDYWRLPGLDRRRIDREVTNVTNYSFGRPGSLVNRAAFIIDQDGLIVDQAVLSRKSEQDLSAVLDVLFRREVR